MKSLSKYALLGALWLSALSACQNTNSPNPDSSNGGLRTLSAPTANELSNLRDSELPDANTRFGLKLFQDLVSQSPRENLFVSPLSVSIALSMLYNGASGETQQEMAKALEYTGLDLKDTVNQGHLTLRKRLQNQGKGVEVLLANALWGPTGLSLQDGFAQANKAYYDAALEGLPFGSPSAVERINRWASDNTRGLIPKVIEEIDPNTILLLMNAIYFKGDWSTPFEANQTESLPFYKADETQENQAIMHHYDKWRYGEVDGTQVVSLPYGEAERTEMLAFMPPKGTDLAAWIAELDTTRWQNLMTSLRTRDGRVGLPKFKLSNNLPLNDTLKRLGMAQAFSELDADFGALLPPSSSLKPYVSGVKQDAVIEVNEKGTEAAAVTTITVGATSVQLPQDPFEMIMDRPFMYAIYDRDTESILFMGAFNDPQ